MPVKYTGRHSKDTTEYIDPYDELDEYRGGGGGAVALPGPPSSYLRSTPLPDPPAFVAPLLPREGGPPITAPPVAPWDGAPRPVPSPPGVTPQPAVPIPVPPGFLPPGATPDGSFKLPKIGPYQPPNFMPPTLPDLSLPDVTKPFDIAGDFMMMIVVMALVKD